MSFFQHRGVGDCRDEQATTGTCTREETTPRGRLLPHGVPFGGARRRLAFKSVTPALSAPANHHHRPITPPHNQPTNQPTNVRPAFGVQHSKYLLQHRRKTVRFERRLQVCPCNMRHHPCTRGPHALRLVPKLPQVFEHWAQVVVVGLVVIAVGVVVLVAALSTTCQLIATFTGRS